MLVLRIRTSHLICRSKWTSSTLLISLISFALYVLYGIPPADQVALLRGKYFVNEDLMRMCPKASSVVEPVLGKISYVRVIQHWRHHLSDESVINRALKCSANEEEEGEVFQSDVPLAFSIMAHKQLGLLELLLHQISHPRNSVCIHVDRKSSPKFHLGVEKLIECQRKKHRGLKIVKYSPSLNVYWGHISLQKAEMACMEHLHGNYSNWRYYINLAASELTRYPINSLQKRIEATLNGGNLLGSVLGDRSINNRIKFSHYLDVELGYPVSFHMRRKSQTPFGLSVAKGLKNGFFSRSFVDFLLHNKISKTFLTWLEDTFVPDESFAQTLLRVFDRILDENSIEHEDVRKSRRIAQDRRDLERYTRCGPGKKRPREDGLCPRYSRWTFDNEGCEGRFIRDICHFNVWDLASVAEESQYFALVNKFDLDVDPFAAVCWAEFVNKQ